MTTTVCSDVREKEEGFRSPPRVLVDWFQRSRDNWKSKHMTVKAELKKFKVRVSDVSKSRDCWKEKAKASERDLALLQGELERLRQQVSEVACRDASIENDATPEGKKEPEDVMAN